MTEKALSRDPGARIRALTPGDIAALNAMPLMAKGKAALRVRCERALMRAAALDLRGLGALDLETVAALAEAAADVEGTGRGHEAPGRAPVAVPEDVAGTPWKLAGGTEVHDQVLERLVDIYGGQLEPAAASADRGAPAPKASGGEGTPQGEGVTTGPRVAVDYAPVPAPVTVRLAYPLIVEGRTLRTVALAPPSYGDAQAVKAGTMTFHAMVAGQAGIDPAVLDALRYPDAERVIGVALDMAPSLERR